MHSLLYLFYMNSYPLTLLPNTVTEAFPILNSTSYIRQLAALTPLYPDTIFYLFAGKDGGFFALVMTDYPDPLDQSEELKQISGSYAFTFTHLITPHANNQRLSVRSGSDMNTDFSVPDPESYYQFYLAAVHYTDATSRP